MTAEIGRAFRRLGGERIDPATVLPAALPLDLCGEAVRARLCVFKDHANRDLALRPDLTLPVALAEIDARKDGQVKGERVHQYAARAFRLPSAPEEPTEFFQIGFERFGAPVTAQNDAEAYQLVSEVSEEADVKTGVARLGDLGILPAFIDALGLSPTVNASLRRAFREAGGVSAYLARMSPDRKRISNDLVGMARGEVEDHITEVMETEGIQHFGNRSMDEIVTRLIEQAEDANAGAVPDNARSILERVLALECPPRVASERLRALAEASGLQGVDKALDTLSERMQLMFENAPRFLEQASFSPGFGRRFTYYDGFVFEIAEVGARAARPFGAGGRYDRLLSDLSRGAVSATAIGGVVRPDRLALAANAGSADQ